MILTQDARSIDTNVDQSQVFKIKTTAQAFKILSSNLYSNKIRAIVRELSCNAVDSHKLAGNPNPFEVHLPNTFDPYFSVRDFGVGLSETDVFELYTSYFESTKSQSNDFIGALGLGSKSPFSYVDSFTIESIYNGEKKDYSAYISEAGVPTISLLNTIPCDAHNGIEVKIPVEENDFRRFRQEAEIVFYAFPQMPIIKGSSEFIDYKEQEKKDLIRSSGNGWKILKSMPGSISNGAYACQGCINYPLNDDNILAGNVDDSIRKKVTFILWNSIVIDFPLGSLDIAASREEISYDPRTIKAILARLSDIYDEFIKDFANIINSLSLYDAVEFYRSNILTGINYGNRLSFTHAPTNTIIDSDKRFELTAPAEYIIAQENDNSPYGIRLGRHPLVGEQKCYIYPDKRDKSFVVVDEQLTDLKFREKLRIFITSPGNNFRFPLTIAIIKPEEIKDICEKMGNPPLVNISSITIPDVPYERKKAKPRETEANFSYPNILGRSFEKTIFDIKSDKLKCYIINRDSDHYLWKTGVVNWKSVDGSNVVESYWLEKFFGNVKLIGMFPSDINFYVVRKKETGYKRFIEDTNFCRFDEYLEKHLISYIDSHEARIINLFSLQNKINAYQNISILKESRTTRTASAFKKYFWDRISTDTELKKAYLMIGHNRTRELCDSFWSFYTSDCLPIAVKTKLNLLRQKSSATVDINKLYPMLKYVEFSSYSTDDEKLIACSDYVNSIAKEVI